MIRYPCLVLRSGVCVANRGFRRDSQFVVPTVAASRSLAYVTIHGPRLWYTSPSALVHCRDKLSHSLLSVAIMSVGLHQNENPLRFLSCVRRNPLLGFILILILIVRANIHFNSRVRSRNARPVKLSSSLQL